MNYFLHAPPLIRVLLSLLLFASLTSWFLIFERYFFFRREERFNRRFTRLLSEIDLERENCLRQIELSFQDERFMFFQADFFLKLSSLIRHSAQLIHIRRGVGARFATLFQAAIISSERGLTLLATIGSVAVFVGLLGTVFGIMDTFESLRNVTQISINSVAPGISDALVATALGICVALPATVAYNFFLKRSEKLLEKIEVQGQQLLESLLSRDDRQEGMRDDGQ